MIYRTEAWCNGCNKALVRVWADKPFELEGVVCLDGPGHRVTVSSEGFENVGSLYNGTFGAQEVSHS